ncbi:MAG: hypothetical protein ACI9MR_003041 [Myxococcota bacterium]|jgi:hypothetical protein
MTRALSLRAVATVTTANTEGPAPIRLAAAMLRSMTTLHRLMSDAKLEPLNPLYCWGQLKMLGATDDARDDTAQQVRGVIADRVDQHWAASGHAPPTRTLSMTRDISR